MRPEAPPRAPQPLARTAGALYLLTLAAGIVAQGFISNRFIVWNDAGATAANLAAHRALFTAGYGIYLGEMAAQIAFIALFYLLLKPVSRAVSLVAAFLGLAGCAVKSFARVLYLVPLSAQGSRGAFAAFTPEQHHALALLLLRINDRGAAMSLVYFGLYALLTGMLIARSGFLPRVLGWWSALAGLGWLAYLDPPLGDRFFLPLAAFAFPGALALALWLLIRGVNAEAWQKQAAAQRPPNA